ncbi:hypothetical protein HMPREF0484_3412 [Klebsiella pneumoniae subsp. rhinoscleromatis ATCC 13884]|uniref:hypothetical protein n=1 Tax=Klebsiella pneumoniae TaxID=573 RepID=UPI0001B7602B|nr:hypothetical protein [Klebsiella pneumoniae]EEW40529.1 hypothetical protein HMPREF0484_3412 [Klebsiella pneumoniae subsp. rhinoscleromatis ATCC 13884]
MKIIVVALLSLFFLTACKPTEEKAIELAKVEISHDMKDPSSTQFRDVISKKVGENDDGSIAMLVCGEVNSKNSFGAYSGYTPFVIAINMKSKGFLSSGVVYTVAGKTVDNFPTGNNSASVINPCK